MPVLPAKDASDYTRRLRALAKFRGPPPTQGPNPSSDHTAAIENAVIASESACCGSTAPPPTPPGALRGSYQFGTDSSGAIIIDEITRGVRAGSDFSPSGDFTIEWTQYWTGGSNPRPFSIGSYIDNNIAIAISYEGTLYGWLGMSANSLGSQPPQNEWVHVALVRASGVISIYINGVPNGTPVSNSSPIISNSANLTIGNQSDYTASDGWYTGYITNFRWTNSAVYTGAFTPDLTAELPILTDTVLLLTARPENPWADLTGRHTVTHSVTTLATTNTPTP